jgi:peroxiredoxin Q/BCP
MRCNLTSTSKLSSYGFNKEKPMPALKIGDKAPDFTLSADGGKTLSLKELKGSLIVLYFYPKDDTPGCTKEACDFRDNLNVLKKHGVQVIGVSKDSPVKHDKFKAKYDLNFPLVSDEDGKVCESYGTWVEKSMYGRKYMGIDRATFLIDAQANIAQIWRKVSVTGHVTEVIEAVAALKKAA